MYIKTSVMQEEFTTSPLESRDSGFYKSMNSLKSQVDRRMYSGCDLETTINSFKVFDQINSSEKIRERIEEDLRSSVPDTLFRDTIGEYMYGCYTKQEEVVSECTPSCIKGFSNGKLGTCKFPVIELIGGELKALNDAKGEKGYLFTSSSEDVTNDILDKILKQFNIKKIDIYTYVGDTVEYSHYKTLSTKVEKIEDEHTESSGTPYNFIIVALVIFVFLVIIGAVLYNSNKPTYVVTRYNYF